MLLVAFLVFSIESPIRLPNDFECRLVADDTIAHDIQCIALDPRGEILVGGRGYIKRLIDADRDGVTDSVHTVIDDPSCAPMGLLWESDALFVVTGKGVHRYPITNGQSLGKPTLVLSVKANGEHDAHAIKRGPDGWLYLLCGNMAGVDRSWAGTNSPVVEPVAGCLVRISPDFKTRQIYCDGFRNAYDFDWNELGDVFTYDSDNERCVSLPWYEGCRFYQMFPGAHYGWQSPQHGDHWRMPPYYYDVIAPLCDLGRGSPTGVICYKHSAFPAKYRGGFFLLDWTFGKIYSVRMKASRASYQAAFDEFAVPVGEQGFAPVGGVVEPTTGDLLVAIGGRGTRGAVYRIRYTGKMTSAERPNSPTPADAQLREHRLNICRVIERADDIKEKDALETINANLTGDRLTRQLASIAIHRVGPFDRQNLIDKHLTKSTFEGSEASLANLTIRHGIVRHSRRFGDLRFALPSREEWKRTLEPQDWLDTIRLYQRANAESPKRGKVWEGYTYRISKPPVDTPNPFDENWLREDIESVRREYARLWPDALVDGLSGTSKDALTTWIQSPERSAESVIHYLICIAKAQSTTVPVPLLSNLLLSLDERIQKSQSKIDRNWPLRVREIHERLASAYQSLNQSMLASKSFGRSAHLLFAMAPSFRSLRKDAASHYWEIVNRDADFEWTPDLIRLFANMRSSKVRTMLVDRWDELALREAILDYLATEPTVEDWNRFSDCLESPSPAVVEKALEGIEALVASNRDLMDGTTFARLLRVHDEAEGKPGEKLRLRVLTLLRGRTELLNATREGLGNWLAKSDPRAPEAGRSGVDWDRWQHRLKTISWKAGRSENGTMLFNKTACAGCHKGSALGPDLRGVTKRFSRDDLFRAIVDPNHTVPDRYRTTAVITKSGQVRNGIVIYVAADGMILQEAPDKVVRINGDDIAEQMKVRRSMMPEKLLDGFSDQEIADLYEYLKAL